MVITDVRQIRDLLPTMQQFCLKGNFVTADERKVSEKPLYAFVINNSSKTFVDRYKVNFSLYVGEYFLCLVLVKDGEKITRYNDFIVCPRKGYYTEDMWPWDVDDIGLSVISGNISKNIIYFATDETDAITIRMGLHNGKRNVKKRFDDLNTSSYNQLMRNVLRSYQAATGNVVRHSTMLCLPAPKKEVVLTTEVVIV
jgi:hypothetical protein